MNNPIRTTSARILPKPGFRFILSSRFFKTGMENKTATTRMGM
jgi:hypothetical protein